MYDTSKISAERSSSVKIASLFGLSAPMFLIFNDVNHCGAEEIRDYCSMLNATVDSGIVFDMRKELEFFNRYFERIKYKYVPKIELDTDAVFVDYARMNGAYRLQNGQVLRNFRSADGAVQFLPLDSVEFMDKDVEQLSEEELKIYKMRLKATARQEENKIYNYLIVALARGVANKVLSKGSPFNVAELAKQENFYNLFKELISAAPLLIINASYESSLNKCMERFRNKEKLEDGSRRNFSKSDKEAVAKRIYQDCGFVEFLGERKEKDGVVSFVVESLDSSVELSEEEYKVLEYLNQLRTRIPEYLKVLTLKPVAKVEMFDSTFDLILRRGTGSLRYRIRSKLAKLFATDDSNAFYEQVDALKRDVDILAEQIEIASGKVRDEDGNLVDDVSNDTVMTEEQFIDAAQRYGLSDNLYKLLSSGVVSRDAVTENNVKSLSKLENGMYRMSMATINSYVRTDLMVEAGESDSDESGVYLDIEGWEVLIEKFAKIGIYNLNFNNLQLFYDSLQRISFVKKKITADQSVLDNFRYCIKDIKTLLVSMCKIGTPMELVPRVSGSISEAS